MVNDIGDCLVCALSEGYLSEWVTSRGTCVLLQVNAAGQTDRDDDLGHQLEYVALTEPGKRGGALRAAATAFYQPQSSSATGRATTFTRASSSVAKETWRRAEGY